MRECNRADCPGKYCDDDYCLYIAKATIYSELQYTFNVSNNFTEDHNFTDWSPWSPCPRTCLMSHEKQEHFTQRQKRQCASLNADEGLHNGYGMSCPALETNMDLYFKTQTCELPRCKGMYKTAVFWRSKPALLTENTSTVDDAF